MKMTFYIGFHTGPAGSRPDHQDEHIEEVEMEIERAGKLLRAMVEFIKYALHGHKG